MLNRTARVAREAAFLAVFLCAALAVVPALAQPAPSGQATLNQGRSATLLTPGDSTTITATRGLHIGDAAACNIAVVFSADSLTTGAVTLPNVQPGLSYPYSIKRLLATGTTCTHVTALR
jgi:hypothetical protein